MILSENGLLFIKHEEGCYHDQNGNIAAYRDSIGVLTIGYGHTGNDVYENMVITQEEADALLMKDTAIASNAVNTQVLTPITQNAFDALVSFTYNVGVENFERSTLLKLLNQGDYDEAASQFQRWDFAGNQQLDGLLNRREKEAQLFVS